MSRSAPVSTAFRWPRCLPWLLAIAIVLPSALWIAADHSVWAWDQAFYGMGAVDIWYALATRPDQWWEAMLHVYSAKAPAIGWFGQLFVPLGELTGSIETGLLASVLSTHIASLVLMFRVGQRIGPSSPLAVVAGMLFLGAGPLFVGMSHHFLTEALQVFVVTYVYWVAVESHLWPVARIVGHVLLAVGFAFLVKLVAPVYFWMPLCIPVYFLFRPALGHRREFPAARDALLVLAALAVCWGATAWYLRNGKQTWDFARFSASSEQAAALYGSKAVFVDKVGYWLRAVLESFVSTADGLWLVTAAVVVAVLASKLRGDNVRPAGLAEFPGPVVWVAGLQVIFLIALFSSANNEERRYVLPMGPSLAVLLVFLLARLRTTPVCIGILVALSGQWAVLHARSLGVVGPRDQSYWNQPPTPRNGRSDLLEKTVSITCKWNSAGQFITVGADTDWLNMYTLQFYSSKAQFSTGVRCVYGSLGTGETDLDAAWARLIANRPPFLVSLEPSAVPDDSLNRVTRGVFDRVAADDRFVREDIETLLPIVVFRRAEFASGR